MSETLSVIGWSVFIASALMLLGVIALTSYNRVTVVIAYTLLGSLVLGFCMGMTFGILAAING